MLIAVLALLGLVSFIYTRVNQQAGASLLVRQEQTQALTGSTVGAVVRLAPDPVTNAPGLAARCHPEGGGALMNPWRCVIAYRSRKRIQYTVTIQPDGSYTGDHQVLSYRGRTGPTAGSIRGCCIALP
ncbi:MAG: hypothetical protein M3016_10715 [Actinomycetota bacterium]|nr:hypothetical protein [Actinomycetota bacterium]